MTKDQGGNILVYEAVPGNMNQIRPDSANVYDATYDVSPRDKFNYQTSSPAYSSKTRDDKGNPINPNDNEKQFNQRYQDFRSELDLNKKRLIDSDFKKSNELQPTMLVVTFNVVGDNGDIIDRKSFICGVKCRMITTPSIDIAERLLATNKSKLSFKNFIRATTGEIKFNKDFLFAIQQQKLQAKNDAKRGEAAKIWNTLKARSNKNIFRKLSRDGNDASAITTLIVSQDTVNFMKNTNKFDLSTVKNAKLIMSNYNLLCLVIADDANEVVKFLYDGQDMFEQQAYSFLEKENNDKSYKKIINLMSQNRRF